MAQVVEHPPSKPQYHKQKKPWVEVNAGGYLEGKMGRIEVRSPPLHLLIDLHL
jgi:hypothetical protein